MTLLSMTVEASSQVVVGVVQEVQEVVESVSVVRIRAALQEPSRKAPRKTGRATCRDRE